MGSDLVRNWTGLRHRPQISSDAVESIVKYLEWIITGFVVSLIFVNSFEIFKNMVYYGHGEPCPALE